MADAQASGACGSNIVWVQVPSPAFMRKCRNWQTSKTKDLVLIASVWVQVPSSALFFCLKSLEIAVNGIKLRKSRITHSVVWDFFMEKY